MTARTRGVAGSPPTPCFSPRPVVQAGAFLSRRKRFARAAAAGGARCVAGAYDPIDERVPEAVIDQGVAMLGRDKAVRLLGSGDERVYVAIRDRVEVFEASTGRILATHGLDASGQEWGYVARVGDVLHWIGGRLRRKGIVAIFSDFFDDPDKLIEGLRRLTHAGHEPILFQVLDPQELDFDYEQLRRLDGLEGTGRLRVDPKALRKAYREEIRSHQDELKRQARSLSIDFIPLTTSTPLDVALSTYLAHRSARARVRS